jgi:prepilin-type N-terminal cleavage/methylation domain-containing protein/prepilin-type processing-associated H-X9-DG protein
MEPSVILHKLAHSKTVPSRFLNSVALRILRVAKRLFLIQRSMLRQPLKRSAFTLVELLVVISIIGLLMSLTLPAINAARETGRKTACMNNIKNISLAIKNFASKQKRFPGYRGNMIITGNTGNAAREASWPIAILNEMDDKLAYTSFVANTLTPGYKSDYVCPTNPPDRPTEAVLCYVVNSGRPDSTSSPTDLRGSGVCHNLSPGSNVAGFNRNLAVSYGAGNGIPDGESKTLLLTENLNAADSYDSTDEKLVAFVWHPGTSATNISPPERRVNGRWSGWNYGNATTPASDLNRARPSSFHSGGVNAAFADGHTGFIREDIDYQVYRTLMTSNGNSAAPPDNALKDTAPNNQPAEALTLSEADYQTQ